MKKTSYIIALITAILLIGCGNNASSDTPADNVLSDEVNDAVTMYEAQSVNDESVSTLSDFTEITENPNKKEKKSDTSSVDAKTETDTDANETSLPEYTVTSFEETKTMYSTDSVNIRKGPSTDFDIIGGLKFGQEVTITGQADTSWYEIQYGEAKAFVCNDYLQDEKPTYVAGIILVGDSRFVQMKNCVGKNSHTWIAESGKGYNWFNQTAIEKIDSCVGDGTKILINLGVNDLGNLQKYISLINTKADEWTENGATVYYASVNPVLTYNNVTEEQVEYFNSQMQASLNDNVHWIDSHSYLNSVGYRLVDGLHYSKETYQTIYAYYMSCI